MIEFEDREYTPRELDEIATQLLRDDAKEIDPETGKKKGISGEHPILFEDHLYMRRRREIQTEAGIPDPAYTRDPRFPHQIPLYNRTSPNGRKVNSEKQRKEGGASFYR
jgi:hypothetical protein